jgi:phosphohistidine phosphatase SixA
LTALCLLAFATPAAQPESAPAPDKTTLVILVRHAEKATDHDSDPTLTQQGQARAKALARMLARSGVTHLFSSEYRRCLLTLEPLSRETGVEVKVIPAREPERQIRALQQLPAGSVAVVAGHSNTVPDLARRLGGELTDLTAFGPDRVLGDDEHDRLFLLILPSGGGAVQTLELRYGE